MGNEIPDHPKRIYLFTDGACSGNPGRGGYGAILRFGDHEKELSEGFVKTTNNRMELMAVIKGLEALKGDGHHVVIVSDSKYVIEPFDKGWIANWQKRGWKKIKNPDLWQRLLKSYDRQHISFQWVKGHQGHFENERCDELAVQAYKAPDLKPDTGYLQMPDDAKL